MTLKQYFVIMSLGVVLCWLAWSLILVNVDPFQDVGVGKVFFFICLFFALLGTVSLVSFLIRYYFSNFDSPLFRLVQRSFRDAFIISFILISGLYFQSQGYLRWWNAGVFVVVFILLLLFKLFNKKENIQKDS